MEYKWHLTELNRLDRHILEQVNDGWEMVSCSYQGLGRQLFVMWKRGR